MPFIQALEIHTVFGPVLIRMDEVEIVGDFAIHRQTGSPSQWTITHVASGYSVMQRFVDPVAARAAAQRLLPLVDWSQVSPASMPSKAAGKRVKREIAQIREEQAA